MKLATFLVLALATTAMAHPLAPALLEIRASENGTSEVLLRTSAALPATALTPRLPERCATTAESAPTLVAGAIERRSRVGCELRTGDTLAIDGPEEVGVDAVVRVVGANGDAVQALLTTRAPTFELPSRRSSLAVATQYLGLGVEHLATGFDHLLFVAGLFLLVPGRRRLVWTLTAFTLGHSLTLAAAVLGLIRAPTMLVEIGIAASLLFLAAEIAERDRRASGISSRPFAMAAGFGLLHGFGFAGALAETGLPAGEIPLALVSFNVGIELGQIAVVVLLAGFAAIAARFELRAPRLVPAYAIGALAGYWVLARSAVFFG